MITSILLIPVAYTNVRDVINTVEGQTYPTTKDLRDFLTKELKIEGADNEEEMVDIQLYNLSDFTQASNDDLINYEGNFICYVHFKK